MGGTVQELLGAEIGGGGHRNRPRKAGTAKRADGETQSAAGLASARCCSVCQHNAPSGAEASLAADRQRCRPQTPGRRGQVGERPHEACRRRGEVVSRREQKGHMLVVELWKCPGACWNYEPQRRRSCPSGTGSMTR